MLVAFAIAIALHEILAGLVPLWQPRAQSEPEVITRVVITRVAARATPTPTPPPPPPPPRVVSHARVIAPTETHVVANTTTGKSARKELVHREGAARPKPPTFSHAKPIWDLPVGAQGAGAGTKSGAGSLGNGGTGTGSGNSGTGGGAAAGTEPCGFVTFMDPHGARYDPRTRGFWVDVQMSVHFPDGHTETTQLDYPWYYPSAAVNPFENQDMPMLFQPPPRQNRADEPALVQYVIRHSTAEGTTLLKDCP